MGYAASPIIEAFRELTRLYSHAERAHANARATDRGNDRREAAISMKQSIEAEVESCFQMKRAPNFAVVERRARGEIE